MATKTDEALEKLEAGIAALTSSDRWQDYLRLQGCFPTYSFNNCLLIEMQYPEATQVAGFQAWKRLGRSVQKGQNAIKILAPIAFRRQEEDPETGEMVERSGIRGFRTVPVFDVSQTEGKELAKAPVSRLYGDDLGLFERLRAVSNDDGWRVTLGSLGGPNGYCRFRSRQIEIEESLSPLHRAKTLAHEIAHTRLHDPADYADHRGDMELEAESVAFVVLDHFGLSSGDYSFGYIAHWQGQEDAVAKLRTLGGRVQRTAKRLIEALEEGASKPDLAAVA